LGDVIAVADASHVKIVACWFDKTTPARCEAQEAIIHRDLS
jgi:hypothetical protein